MKDRQPRQQRLITPAPVHDERSRPQNQSLSPKKKATPDHGTKTPAPVAGSKGKPGHVPGQKGAKVSRQESAVRKKVRGP